MRKEEKESWESRFRKQFGRFYLDIRGVTEINFVDADKNVKAVGSDDIEQFISSELSRQREDILRSIEKTLTSDTTKMKFTGDGKELWERGRKGIGIEPCVECSNADKIDELLDELSKEIKDLK